jgi:photosystem II stability/assembly factor-like uncharacterized protein
MERLVEALLKSKRWLVAALALAALAGCGGSDGVAPPPPTEGSATLGAAGGTVPGPDGVAVTVPVDALATDLTLRVARDSTGAPPLLDDIPPLSGIYSFTPHGIAFRDTVRVRVPFDASLLVPGHRPVFMYAQPGGRWTMLVSDVTEEAGALTAPLLGFSWGYVADLNPGPGTPVAPMSLVLVSPAPASLPFASPTNSFRRLEQAQTIRIHAELAPYMTQPGRSGSCASTSTLPVPRLELVRVIGPWPMPTPYVAPPIGITHPGAPVVGSASGTRTDFDVPIDQTHNGTAYFLVRLYCGRWRGDGTVDASSETNPLQFGFVVLRVDIATPVGAPTITQQPQDVAVTAGNRAEFRVAATAPDALTIGWQRSNDGGSTWANTGVTGDAYAFAPAQASDSGAKLRANVCNQLGVTLNCVTSNVATLTVVPATVAPVFTQPPQSMSVVEGQSASFTAVVSATPTPTVRWYREATSGPATQVGPTCTGSAGQTACTYTTVAASLADSGARFFAIATNGTDNTMSAVATLTVTPAAVAPAVPAAEPADVSVTAGASATFSVNASGTAPLSYQWQRDGTNLVGANSASYTLANAQSADNGVRFRVIVSNSAGSAASREATLTVTAPPPPASSGICTSSNTAGWCWARPAPHGNDLSALAFDGSAVQVVGPRTAMRSTDAGATWTTTFNALDVYWWDLAAPGNGVLLGATQGGFGPDFGIYRSTDGGQTWASVLREEVFSIAVENATQGVAVGRGIWRTSDGGATWSVAQAPSSTVQLDRVTSPAAGVYVAIGYMLGTGAVIMRSTDGGQTWTSPVPNTTEQLADVAFGNAMTGVIITGYGKVLRTTDGGATWSMPSEITPNGLATVAFASPTTVVTISAQGPVFRSTDGGITWAAGDDLGFSGVENLRQLRFRSSSEGYAVAMNGQVWRTSDAGVGWTLMAGGSDLEAFSAVRFRYGAGLAAGLGGLYETQDDGVSWVQIDARPVYDVALLDNVVRVSVGVVGIRRTADRGQTWTTVAAASGQALFGLAFVPSTGLATTGVAVGNDGSNGVMVRTTDSGLSWSPVAIGAVPQLWAIAFSDSSPNLGIAAGSQRTLLRTTDAGASWTPITMSALAPNEVIQAVRFSSMAVFIAADSGLYRSTDGGFTWSHVYQNERGSMLDVAFLSATDAIAVGVSGAIARSTDGGATWTRVDVPVTTTLSGVAYSGSGAGVVAVGDGGAILRNTQAGAP